MSWRTMGLKPWIWQRLSAIYMGGFIAVVVGIVVICPPLSYTDWRDLLLHPVFNVATLLFWGSLLVHLWVGIRDLLMDYIGRDVLRSILLVGLWFYLMILAIWLFRLLTGLL